MLRCIHCNGYGIRSLAKRWSSRELPATCAVCGKLSHVIASAGSGIPAATFLIVLAFGVIGAFVGHPLLGGLCGIPFAAVYNIWAWRDAEMFPIACDASSSARRATWLVNLLIALGIIGS